MRMSSAVVRIFLEGREETKYLHKPAPAHVAASIVATAAWSVARTCSCPQEFFLFLFHPVHGDRFSHGYEERKRPSVGISANVRYSNTD